MSGLFVNKTDSAKPSPSTSSIVGPKDVKKRWMYIGGGVIALVLVSSYVTGLGSDSSTSAPPEKKDKGMINISPTDADKKAFYTQTQQDLVAARDAAKNAQASASKTDEILKSQAEDIKQLKAALAAAANAKTAQPAYPAGITPPPVKGGDGVTIPSANLQQPPIMLPPTLKTSAGVQSTSNVPTAMLPPAISVSGQGPLQFEAPKSSPEPSEKNVTSDNVKAKSSFKKNENAGLLPAGAFAPVALLNGLDAGTSSAVQSNPMPVLMNITDVATLPGAASYSLKSCFGIGTGYGDLSAERVYIRISRISCVDKQKRLILSQEVGGYLVDSDGKLGLRGTVADRQGAKLGKALLAGFAQGLASSFGAAQSTTTTGVLGTATSVLGGGDALKASGLQGAQNAASQLAQFYLKEAQNIFPVISVDAGRTGSVVFTGSTNLTWGEAEGAYTKEVKPE